MFNIKRLGIENSVMIVAGDCVIGFEKEAHYTHLYSKLSKHLKLLIIYYYWFVEITMIQPILTE